MSPIGAAHFVLGDVAADEPVADSEADIDSPSSLGGEVVVHGADGENKVLEGKTGGLGLHSRFGSFLAHAPV